MSHILAFFGPFVAEHSFLSIFFFLLLFGFTLPISEEIALVLVGIGVRGSETSFGEALLVSWVALVLADICYYALARLIGPRMLRMKLFSRFMKPERVMEGERYFNRRGSRIIFMCRFVVGLRAPAILGAGFLRMPLKRFLLYDGLALLVATPLWLAVGFAFGAQLDSEVGTLGKVLAFIGPVAVVAASYLVFRSVKRDRERAEAESYNANNEEPSE